MIHAMFKLKDTFSAFKLIPNMSHIREYGFKFTNMNNVFKMAVILTLKE